MEFLEDARWEYLQPAVDQNFFEVRNLIFVVVNINVSYKKPVMPNTKIKVEVTGASFNNKSIIVRQEIRDVDSSMLMTYAEVTFVLLDKVTWKPASITEEIITKFEELNNA